MSILNAFFNAIQIKDILQANKLALKMSSEARDNAHKFANRFSQDEVVTQLERAHLSAFEQETWTMDKLHQLLQSINQWTPDPTEPVYLLQQLAGIQQFTIGIIQEKIALMQITQLKEIWDSYYKIVKRDKDDTRTLDKAQINIIDNRLKTVKEMIAILKSCDSPRKRLKKFNENFGSFQNAARDNLIPSDEGVIYKLICTIKALLHIKHNYGIFKSEPEKLKEKVESVVHKKK